MAIDPLSFLDEDTSSDPLSFLDEKPKTKLPKAARIGAQYGLGLADRATLPLAISSAPLRSKSAQHAEFRKGIFEDLERLAEQKATGVWDEQDEELFQELQEHIRHPEKAEQFVQTADISASGIGEAIGKQLGIDLEPEGAAEHIGRFAGSFTPKELVSGAKALPKILPKKIKETLPSGLTKTKAVDSKLAKFGKVSPERQKIAISGLDKEAANLTKKSINEHLPLSKKIEEGFDFGKDYEKRFGLLKNVTEQYNPKIDVSPLSKFLAEKVDSYSGIPSLHAEAKKILTDVSQFHKNPQDSLKNLVKIYRSNNRKQKSIFETAQLKGKQKEYSDFLKEYNSHISQSIGESLGKDSPWYKEFINLNKEYSQYLNTEKTLNALAPILGKRAKASDLEKLAFNKSAQDKIALSMGKKGAEEVIQISKDLKLAREALKSIPKSKWHGWEKAAMLSLFVPGTHGIIPAFGAYKAYEAGRRGLGWLLSTPSIRREYGNVLKAIASGDKKSYATAATAIEKEFNK